MVYPTTTTEENNSNVFAKIRSRHNSLTKKLSRRSIGASSSNGASSSSSSSVVGVGAGASLAVNSSSAVSNDHHHPRPPNNSNSNNNNNSNSNSNSNSNAANEDVYPHDAQQQQQQQNRQPMQTSMRSNSHGDIPEAIKEARKRHEIHQQQHYHHHHHHQQQQRTTSSRITSRRRSDNDECRPSLELRRLNHSASSAAAGRNKSHTSQRSDSFELRQSALLSLQTDGTLEHLSALDNLRVEESYIASQSLWRRLAIQASSSPSWHSHNNKHNHSNNHNHHHHNNNDNRKIHNVDNSKNNSNNNNINNNVFQHLPQDTTQKELIQRATFIMLSSMTILAGILWGGMYILLQEYIAASMPFLYSLLMGSILFTCICRARGRYALFVNCQLILILILPLAVHVALGGVQRSGGVMLWSFLCPLGAAFFKNAEESVKWFGLYVGLCGVLLVWELFYYCYFNTNYTSNHNHNIRNNIDEEEEDDYHHNMIISQLYFLMNILGLKSIVFSAVFLFARDLEKEYNQSEEVLLNILPSAIVKRIKRGEFPIVDHVNGVTILFADLVGFTKASTELHPNFLIGLFLRDIFQAFDELVYKHGLEKIKTIGDAYMVVGGLNHNGEQYTHNNYNDDGGGGDDHPTKTMLLALDMFQELERINKKYNLQFELRIGVHTGPVVAGVLGLKRFTYDVWGDSVNTASRMESYGVPGQIHLSPDMYKLVGNMHDHFEFRSMGTIQIKGKGEMNTYVAKPL